MARYLQEGRTIAEAIGEHPRIFGPLSGEDLAEAQSAALYAGALEWYLSHGGGEIPVARAVPPEEIGQPEIPFATAVPLAIPIPPPGLLIDPIVHYRQGFGPYSQQTQSYEEYRVLDIAYRPGQTYSQLLSEARAEFFQFSDQPEGEMAAEPEAFTVLPYNLYSE